MKNINDEQLSFIKTLLEDELTRLLIVRSKSDSVRKFDDSCGKRMRYIKDLIKELE